MNSPAEEAYWNLVAAARAEDGISPDERRVLNAHVLKLGLDSARAREIQAAAEAENPPRLRVPKDGKARLDTLRRILEVVAADGTIAPKELRLIQALGERCAIPPDTLNRLLSLALRKSGLDQAFASLRAGGDVGPEAIDIPGPLREAPASPLRSVPFLARLARQRRRCAGCGQDFAHRDAYARFCRVCEVNQEIRNVTGGWIEGLFGLCFVLLLVPVGFAVEAATDLWSFGWEANRVGGRQRPLVLMLPAAVLTALGAALAAWALAATARRALRLRSAGGGRGRRS